MPDLCGEHPVKRRRVWMDVSFCAVVVILLYLNLLMPALLFFLKIHLSPFHAFLLFQILPLSLLLFAVGIPDSDIPLSGKLLFCVPDPFPVRTVFIGTVFLVFATPLLSLAMSKFALLFSWKLPPQELVNQIRNAHGMNLALMIFSAVVCAPVLEEILFRRLFYVKVEQLTSRLPAALLTAFLFSAMHMNLLHAPSLFLMSLVLQGALRKTNCILVPMLMHALFNSSSIYFLLLMKGNAT